MLCPCLAGVLTAHQGRGTHDLHQALFNDSISGELVCQHHGACDTVLSVQDGQVRDMRCTSRPGRD